MRISVFLLLFSTITTHGQVGDQANMFRFGPTHLGEISTSGSRIYDTRAWEFYAGAPVRSTPLVVKDAIYIGNTLGQFFSLDKISGKVNWQIQTGEAINSSAAADGSLIYFADNLQAVYAVKAATGEKIWTTSLGHGMNYPWRFDYYYSSPVLSDNYLIIGGDDGAVHVLDKMNGREFRKFQVSGPVRGTVALKNKHLFFGDTEGLFYAFDLETGKELWRFHTVGDTLKNEDWGYDRRAIISTPVIRNQDIIFGSRDGYLYCLNIESGQQKWRVNHQISWIISTVAIRDTILVTGTSDGRFVQALNVETGKEIWRFPTHQVVWSSPLIINNQVYAGDFEGQFYCLDLHTGKRISLLQFGDKIMSSPTWKDNRIYIGCDDGYLYALDGRPAPAGPIARQRKFVFYDPSIHFYFHEGADARIKNYLTGNGFVQLSPDSLALVLKDVKNANESSIVFASLYFPEEILKGGGKAILRDFMENGGRIILPGTNPAVFKYDPNTRQPVGLNLPLVDSVFDIHYGPNDTRSFGGLFSSFATQEGKKLGLPEFWTCPFGLKPDKVDKIYGKNENGLVTAFARYYAKGGALIQYWLNPDFPRQLDVLVKSAEWDLQ